MVVSSDVIAGIGAGLASISLGWQIVSWKLADSRISGELTHGTVGVDGDLVYENADGQVLQAFVPVTKSGQDKTPKRRSKSAKRPRRPTPQEAKRETVFAVFVRNIGRSAVSITNVRFNFTFGFSLEHAGGGSRWGDNIPRPLEPGEQAIFLNEVIPMRALVDQVMHDRDVAQSRLWVSVILGTGKSIDLEPVVRVERGDAHRAWNGEIVRTEFHEERDATMRHP